MILPHSFYQRTALQVAPDILGKVLVCRRNGTVTSGRIVEVEVYGGENDPASHAFRGSTPRNCVMFGPGGFAYVYFTYGAHYCMNIVTGRSGKANAVLIRALEPIQGISAMKSRRKKNKLTDLASGPGKLTQALSIHKELNQHDLTKPPLQLIDDGMAPLPFTRTPRIGISEGKSFLYRFVVRNSPHVSRKVFA